jgi:hypothetical protein
MPLRDHFRPPVTNVASWEELHGLWPGLIAVRLNTILPPEYRSGVKIHLGSAVAGFEMERPSRLATPGFSESVLDWEAAEPTLLLDTDELTPPEYEVRVRSAPHEAFGSGGRARQSAKQRQAGSPRSLRIQMSRPPSTGGCVVIVDPVTERSGNLYAELTERIGAGPPATADRSTYAVSCRPGFARGRHRVEGWEHSLAVGGPASDSAALDQRIVLLSARVRTDL